MDMSKFRRNSSFYKIGGVNSRKDLVINQQIDEFNLFQDSHPNTYWVTINDEITPIRATMQDVTDLEMRSDTKNMLTPLGSEVYTGDIVNWNGVKWFCIYKKQKNVINSNKAKIQPTNFTLKLPFYKDSVATIAEVPTLITSGYSDIRQENVPFQFDVTMIYITVQYNDITRFALKKLNRVMLHEGEVYQITGADYTQVDEVTGKGAIRLNLKSSLVSSDYDNEELGICDYYKFFPKTSIIPPTDISNVVLNISKNNLIRFESTEITSNTPVEFKFDGENYNCTLVNITDTSCTLQSSNNVGIVKVKAVSKDISTDFATVRVSIK